MKVHTSEFKEEIKKLGRQLGSKITYGETELGNEELNSVTPHYESTILKSVMKQLDVDSNVEIPLETIINYQFGVKVGNGYEYLDYGNYVVYKVEKQEDTRSWKITCYDKMLYAMKPYESLGVSFPISIKDYLQAICTKLGLTLASGNFANEDKMIMNELYLDASGNGLDYTFRDVLDEIAQATGSTICINENDELEVRYPQNVGEYKTTEGTDLLLENVDDVKDIDYELNGDTIQDGTPTPTTPIEVKTVTGRQNIEVCQKNLFNKNTANILNANLSNSKINSSASERVVFIPCKPNTTYTFSISLPSSYKRNTIATTTEMPSYNMNIENAVYSATAPKTYTTNANAKYIVWLFYSTSNPDYTEQQTKDSMMINEGNTALPYEEYKGKSYEINLGKNLFDLTNITMSRGTATLENGEINLTWSGGFNLDLSNVVYNLVKGTSYTISFKHKGNSLYLRNRQAGITNVIETNTDSDYTTYSKTLNNITAFEFRFVRKDTTGTAYIKDIQIEKSSTPTSYAPYKTPIELCKIGTYQDFIKKGVGKNLFDYTTSTFYTPSSASIQTENNTITMTALITTTSNNLFFMTRIPDEYLKNGKTYTISSINVSNMQQTLQLQLRNKNGSSAGKTKGFSIVYDDEYALYVIANPFAFSGSTTIQSGTVSVVRNVQVEENTISTEFEPFGYGNKWYLHKEIERINITSSMTWYKSGTTSVDKYYTRVGNWDATLNKFSYCNRFVYKNNGVSVGQFDYSQNSTYLALFFCYATYNTSTINSFKSWLDSNEVYCYVPLPMPTDTEITDTELINQLNSVELLEGMNNISITSGDLSTPLKLTYLSQMDTIDEEYLKDVNVNFGEKFGPVNSVVLSRAAESDSIYQKDDESVEQNGLTEIKIKDNQILNGNNRDEFLPSIFEKLNGLEYYLTDFSSTGVAYYDLLDKYKINVFDNSYKTIMLNNEVDITQGLEEQIYADRLEQSETDYTKSDKTDRKINQAYIIVDKQNQQINSVVQSINTLQSVVNNQGEQVDALGTRLTQTVDNITASVTSIQTELDNGVSLVKTTSVTIDDNGLNVSTDNSKISTTMTNNSFEIKDSGDNMLAFFGYDETENISKSQMDNLTVTNYFVSGYHRTEKFERNGEKRTGHFYIG